jgi:thymidylate synthase (FAD)
MWIEHCERSRQLYEELTAKLSDMYGDVESKLERRKKARQAARSVLPNATETKIFVTMNSRALRHLIELRANPAADVEIRKLAVKVCRILQDKAPLFAYGLDIVKLPDGTEGVESEYKRT